MKETKTIQYEQTKLTHFQNENDQKQEFASPSSIRRTLKTFLNVNGFNDVYESPESTDYIAIYASREIKNPGECKRIFQDLTSFINEKTNKYKWKTFNIWYSYNEKDDDKDIMKIDIEAWKFSCISST